MANMNYTAYMRSSITDIIKLYHFKL